jgi:hypothetical protein
VERLRLQCPIRLGGRLVRSETLLGDGGPYALILSTTLPEVGVALHSSYLGHPDAAEAQISHLALHNSDGETEAHAVEYERLPVPYARRRCLYDHLQRLQDLLEDEGLGPARIDGLDTALALIDA